MSSFPPNIDLERPQDAVSPVRNGVNEQIHKMAVAVVRLSIKSSL